MKRTPFIFNSFSQLLVLATGISIALLLACSKDPILTTKSMLSNRTITPPDEYHNMLWFEDYDHLNEYYDYLNSIANGSDDVDSTLAMAESILGLNYVSLRSTVYKDSLIDREPAYEDWILDDVRTSILNSYREVRIGDSIYVNYCGSHYFVFPKDSATILADFRASSKGGHFDSIPWSLMAPSVNMISASSYLIHASPTTVILPPPNIITPRSPPFYIDFAELPTMCNPLSKIYELRVVDNDAFSFGTVEWDIDFGDGSSPYTNNTSQRIRIPHTFPAFGTYTISVHAETAYEDNNNVQHDVILDQDFDVQIEEECGILEQYNDEAEEIAQNNDEIKIERRFWYNNDIFGQGFGARTTHFRKNNNDNWKRRDADKIEAHYEGSVRSIFGCGVDVVINETEFKTHARTARVSHNIDAKCNPEPFTMGHINCKSVIDGELFYRHITVESDGGVTFIKEFDACN